MQRFILLSGGWCSHGFFPCPYLDQPLHGSPCSCLVGNKDLFYGPYVDDKFCVLETEQDADLSSNYINSRDLNIRFTMEKDVDNLNN